MVKALVERGLEIARRGGRAVARGSSGSEAAEAMAVGGDAGEFARWRVDHARAMTNAVARARRSGERDFIGALA